MTTTRRHVVLGSLSALAAACTSAPTAAPLAAPAPSPRPSPPPPETDAFLKKIEERLGGSLGVFALHSVDGRSIAYRAEERFAMCSTFKWVLAAAVLDRVERAQLSLEQRVTYGSADLLEYAPVTRAHLAEGAMTIGDLARAAVVVSDNTAANLLLSKIGGPAGLTAFVRALGDTTTNFDRYEPHLNTNDPADPQDTTTPRAMATLMQHVLCEPEMPSTGSPSNGSPSSSGLSKNSRERLLGWLEQSETGRSRLRAGFPKDWRVGDKTGTCQRNAINDVAIATPPGRAPLLLVVFMSGGTAGIDVAEAAHAEIAALAARTLYAGA